MFPQDSKISSRLLFLLIVLFQQFAVGSMAYDIQSDSTMSADSLTITDSTKNRVKTDSLSLTQVIDTNVANDDVLKSPVKYHARDSLKVNIEKQIVFLYGAATVDYEDLHLKADYIVIDMENKELFAEGTTDSTGNLIGRPEFLQADQQFKSNQIRYNFQTKKGRINYVMTKEGEGYIHGDVVKKDPENNFFIRNGQYTTCDQDTPHYSISSRKLKVINNSKIVTGPAFLTVQQIPTPVLVPFGFFPNKKGRSSGILFPAFGESAERGFFFQRLGYYFGTNDNVNFALTTDLFTKGSYVLDGYSIYKKRYRYNGNLRLSYAYTVNSEKELPDYSVTKDFHINWTHSKDPKANPNSNFSANVNAGSSRYYQNTISSVNNFLTNTFQSAINYSYTYPDLPINYGISVTHSQNTITRDIRITSPDLTFNVTRIFPFKNKERVGKEKWYEKIGTNYSMRATNYIQTKDTLLFRNESLDQFQNGIQHTLPFATAFNVAKHFNISPSFSYSERWYFKTTEYEWNNELQKIDTIQKKGFRAARDYQAAIAVTTRIYGMYQFKKGKIAFIRHVMTPSASLNYRPDFGKAKYGYYKSVQTDATGREQAYSVFQNNVYGGPSNGQFANLAYSLDNNIEMKVRTETDSGTTLKKIKVLESIRLSGGYNIIADSLKLSPVAVTGRTVLFERMNVNFSGTFNPYSFDQNNNDIDQFLVNETGKIARLTNASVAMSFALNRQTKYTSKKFSREEVDRINKHPEDYIDFNIPFNLNVNYSYAFSKRGNSESIITQAAGFNGDFLLTPQWKIGYSAWYDITNGKFTNLSFNIYRDLHCWEMRMNWIPFGFQESWNFQINVKASILQDLKLMKRKDFFER